MNLVGGCQELRKSVRDLNQDVIKEWLKQEICWKFQCPYEITSLEYGRESVVQSDEYCVL